MQIREVKVIYCLLTEKHGNSALLEAAYSLKRILVSQEGISDLVLRNLLKSTNHLLVSRLTGWDLLQRYSKISCFQMC